MNTSSYDRLPTVAVPGTEGAAVVGWDHIGARLKERIKQRAARRTIVVIEAYPGVDEERITLELEARLRPQLVLQTSRLLHPPERIDRLIAPSLGGGDPVFGVLSDLTLDQFFDPEQIAAAKSALASITEGVVLLCGAGATGVHPGDVLVYADLARWEIQQRFRRQQCGNLGSGGPRDSAATKYRRAFFVDWRVADRWKADLLPRWDYLLDTHTPSLPKLVDGSAIRAGLRHTAQRPFRVVPFFDPAPWGGQWMRRQFGLEGEAPNYGWGFDCVPEENSLRLRFGEVTIELPALDLVLDQAPALLGSEVLARFGREFPIRFDLLDTMGGGHLSFQVHPLADYIRQHFGLSYTQDESYYLLDAEPDASVYLGLQNRVDRDAMARDLSAAQAGGAAFDVERYAQRWPARKHDHFLIPAGTVHCSGANSLVLEISATPYLFTFKLWDWGRLGLDGRPRPIHLDRGLANIQWERTRDWTRAELVNRIEPVAQGEGWREERTGLHRTQFIESRRHWFTRPVTHDTQGTVHVLNLIEGPEAIVESPDAAFPPLVVHYAETFIVPAAVGRYTIRPLGLSPDRECATIRASVRNPLP